MSEWDSVRVAEVLLRKRHRQEFNGTTPRWAWFDELACRTSFHPSRIDLWVMDTWGKRRATAYEIKVSRSDFLRELRRPKKREPAMAASHYFYFAAPSGLISPEEVPEDCGLIDVWPGRCEVRVKAPARESQPSWELLASIARRAHRLV